MSVNFAIQNAMSGLNAASVQVETVADNVANATNPDYDRKEVQLVSRATDGRGSGVRVASIDRAEARVLTGERRRADATVGEQRELMEAAQRLAQIVGGPDDANSLFQEYQDLETALRSLSDNPESTLARNSALIAAQDLVNFFNDINDSVQRLREDVDLEISRQVEFVNDTLVEIDEVNGQIAKAYNLGQDSVAFEAERDRLVDQISEIIPVETLYQDDGQVFLATTTGAMLLTGNAATFEFTPAGTITADMDYRNAAPGALDGLTLNGGDITPSNTGVQSLAGGSLRALFEVRDVTTVEFQTQIDAIAEDLITRFTAAEPGGSVPAGEAGLFTDNQAAASGVRGLAGRLEVNEEVVPPTGTLDGLSRGVWVAGAPVSGDNSQEIALLEAMTAVQAPAAATGVGGMQTAANLAAEFSSQVTQDALAEEQRMITRQSLNDALVQAEDAATGVDLDVELQNLTLIQNAYAANAQVLQVVNEMMQTLLRI